MSTSATALKAQFDLQTRLFNNTLEGVTDSETNARGNDHVNHMKFIAGHLLNTRLGFMTQLTGGQPDDSYAAQFGRGVKIDPNATYPSINQITSKWNEISGAIGEGITKLPEEALEAKSPVQTPVADDTIRGLLAFLVSHESYHIGQLGLLRKMIGKEAMSYN
jgi:uncharacterized damage-inducible protein DinB